MKKSKLWKFIVDELNIVNSRNGFRFMYFDVRYQEKMTSLSNMTPPVILEVRYIRNEWFSEKFSSKTGTAKICTFIEPFPVFSRYREKIRQTFSTNLLAAITSDFKALAIKASIKNFQVISADKMHGKTPRRRYEVGVRTRKCLISEASFFTGGTTIWWESVSWIERMVLFSLFSK